MRADVATLRAGTDGDRGEGHHAERRAEAEDRDRARGADADLVVMDDPLSALDARGEGSVQEMRRRRVSGEGGAARHASAPVREPGGPRRHGRRRHRRARDVRRARREGGGFVPAARGRVPRRGRGARGGGGATARRPGGSRGRVPSPGGGRRGGDSGGTTPSAGEYPGGEEEAEARIGELTESAAAEAEGAPGVDGVDRSARTSAEFDGPRRASNVSAKDAALGSGRRGRKTVRAPPNPRARSRRRPGAREPSPRRRT